MSLSSFLGRRFKSPWRNLCRSFLISRDRWRKRAKQQSRELQHITAELEIAHQKVQALEFQVATLETQVQSQQPLRPSWQTMRPLPGHQYNPVIISLCCQLCLLIGFRATPKVLKCISEAFDLGLKIPSRDVVRNWICRNGVAILQEPSKFDDWIWMIDHSVQLGKMFVLTVLGIRRGELPVGRPLAREDMSVLAVLPTESRRKETVSAQLQQVAQQWGQPLAVICDGASELSEGVALLNNGNFRGICLNDVKHKIANLLKKELGSDERWKKFDGHLGTTTAAIQQTELEHLMPPRKRLKCRFMSFDRQIDWAIRTTGHLQNHRPSPRLLEKIGWLGDFTRDLKPWQQVREMIGVTLRQANELGVSIGSSEQLRDQLMAMPADNAWVEQIRTRLVEIVAANESLLTQLQIEGIRLPCSTEVLESAFGMFKTIQRHHTRGTFTTLLASFPALFDNCSPQKIRKRFPAVTNKQLNDWLKDAGLKNSTQARRMLVLNST
jgi:hypothetical protein